jgi:hypothetical protein
VLHLAAAEVAIDDLLARPDARLEGDAGEEGAELVVLVLRPLFERVVVALVAVETDAEERLADVLGHLPGLFQRPVVVNRGIRQAAPLRGDELADELVVRLVRRDRLADPLAVRPDRLVAQRLGVALEQVGPLVGPEGDVIPTADQAIHQLLPLLAARGAVFQEGAGLLGRGDDASQVEVDPAEELGIRALVAGEDLLLL